MFRNLFSRGRRFSPDVAKIRVIPKWNVDRTLLFMVVGTMVLTDLPEQLTKSFGEPIFVPVGFARETQESVRGRRWQEDDPHYQTLVRLSRDPRRQKEVISVASALIVDTQKKQLPKSNVFYDSTCLQTWLWIKYPTGPPPEYERMGLEITRKGTKLVSRPVHYENVHRTRTLLNPMTLVASMRKAWEKTKVERQSPDSKATRIAEPLGITFVTHLLSELRRRWKPPDYIPKGHVRVEGFVEIIGDGKVAVMDVDMSVNPEDLTDIYWRSAVVRVTRNFPLGPPDDPKRIRRTLELREVQAEATRKYLAKKAAEERESMRRFNELREQSELRARQKRQKYDETTWNEGHHDRNMDEQEKQDEARRRAQLEALEAERRGIAMVARQEKLDETSKQVDLEGLQTEGQKIAEAAEKSPELRAEDIVNDAGRDPCPQSGGRLESKEEANSKADSRSACSISSSKDGDLTIREPEPVELDSEPSPSEQGGANNAIRTKLVDGVKGKHEGVEKLAKARSNSTAKASGSRGSEKEES